MQLNPMTLPLIIMPLETTARELLYKQVLCTFLAREGFQCLLGSKSQINPLLSRFKGYIYLDKGYHKGTSESLYSIIKSQGGSIISLDEEGGIDFGDNSTLLGRYAPALFEAADLVFLWGEEQKKIVRSHIKNPECVKITGHPRFELLKIEYQNLYSKDVKHLKQQHGDFILINTNMGFGNNIKGDDFVIENYEKRFKNIHQIVAFDKRKMDAIIDIVTEVAAQYPEKEVILRPHPEEELTLYRSAFSSFPNVKVLFEGSVVPWLMAASAMIHPDCTTAVESLFIGKRSLSFLPEDYSEDLVTRIPLEASTVHTDKVELLEELEKRLSASKPIDWVEHPFAQRSFTFSGNTTQHIVQEIKNFAESASNCDSSHARFDGIERVKLRWRIIRRKMNKSLSARLIQNKLAGFDSSMVIENQEVIKKVFGGVSVNTDLISPELVRYIPVRVER